MLNQRHLHLLHHGKDTSLSSRTDLLYAAVNITTIAQLNTLASRQRKHWHNAASAPHCSATQSSRNTPYDTHLVSLHYTANATLTLPIMVKRNPLHRCTRASSLLHLHVRLTHIFAAAVMPRSRHQWPMHYQFNFLAIHFPCAIAEATQMPIDTN